MGVGCTAIIYAATVEQQVVKKPDRPEGPREENEGRRREAAKRRMSNDTPPKRPGPSEATRLAEGRST